MKWFQEEPVLVEVGARCHGGDGLWLALGDECFGCNQAKCAIDSYIFRDVYAMMPDAVSVFQTTVICINSLDLMSSSLLSLLLLQFLYTANEDDTTDHNTIIHHTADMIQILHLPHPSILSFLCGLVCACLCILNISHQSDWPLVP